MKLSTDGLIIKENNYGDSDRILTILTRDKGVIRAFAHGVRRLKNRNATATTLLCYSKFVLFKSKDTYQVDEATAVELFFSLRADIEALAVAQYFCELCLQFAPVEAEAESYLRLVLNSLYFLSTKKRSPEFLKCVTEFRMLSISGYMPNLVACNHCAVYEADVMYFDPLEGMLYCADCKPADKRLMPLSRAVLAAMRHIVYSELNKLYQFELPPETLLALSQVTEAYLLTQSERKFSTLDFYHSIHMEGDQ